MRFGLDADDLARLPSSRTFYSAFRDWCARASRSVTEEIAGLTCFSSLLRAVRKAGSFCFRRTTVENRWDEKAGLRRDAVRSQDIDALEAQEIKETGNEEG